MKRKLMKDGPRYAEICEIQQQIAIVTELFRRFFPLLFAFLSETTSSSCFAIKKRQTVKCCRVQPKDEPWPQKICQDCSAGEMHG